MRPKPGECMGSDGPPVPEWDLFEEDGSTTGVCTGCLKRMALDEDGLVPPHKRPK
jgi:hypothetical protein